jgi:acyl carrier protein
LPYSAGFPTQVNHGMASAEIIEQIQRIFRDVLGQPELVLTETLTAPDVDGWDSFTHISILTTIEKHYGIRFNLGELDELRNVGDIYLLVERKLNQSLRLSSP